MAAKERTVGDLVHARSEPSLQRPIAELTKALQTALAALESREMPTVTVNVPEAQPPAISVKASETPAPVIVNLPGQPPSITVNVPESPPPTVNVEPEITVLPPVARAYNVQITERDREGFIRAFKITPA